MKPRSVYICGIGIICSLGTGPTETEQALRKNRSAIKPLTLFDLLQDDPLPVGQVGALNSSAALPRTHLLAHSAAVQAMEGAAVPPDAVILGTTTGGILRTEQLLRDDDRRKELYNYHGLHSVADYIAHEFNCTGPAISVSTACSSGVVAIALGLQMLRKGQARSVLVGGVDSLSRLTYFGFHSLQLVDRNGCKPLDLNRQGMAVAEGAGMLLLTGENTEKVYGEVLGAGLSCDAYHPAAPHPEGRGAFMAMQNALDDAGLRPEDIGYINLHGTGTPDNDLAESRAVNRLFSHPPPLSSIKGASGHSLAAAGAIEAVISAIALSHDLLPANTSLQTVDPTLELEPLLEPKSSSVKTVLTNSFGFGGNNGSLVIGRAGEHLPVVKDETPQGFGIHGYFCFSGAGDTAATMELLRNGTSVSGRAGLDTLSTNLPPRLIRRLKRLPRMALALASGVRENSGPERQKLDSVFMGTGWGAMSETHDFLKRLNDSEEQFPSPTDFVGSVHNAPASQVAILFGATGANITTSGGDYSFEQALLAAELMYDDHGDSTALVMGADEGHDAFSPLFDPSVSVGSTLADGGGALCLSRGIEAAKSRISIPFYRRASEESVIDALVESLWCITKEKNSCAAVFAGIPKAMREKGEKQLEQFLAATAESIPVIDYRRFTGEFASASAVAAAIACSCLETGVIPGGLTDGVDIEFSGSRNTILILGLGQYVTAMELSLP